LNKRDEFLRAELGEANSQFGFDRIAPKERRAAMVYEVGEKAEDD